MFWMPLMAPITLVTIRLREGLKKIKKRKDGIFHLSYDPPTHPPKMENKK